MYFGNDPRPGDNKVRPIHVENDEYVVNRNAARKFKPMLDTLNFVVEPRFDNENTAHSAIDEAIAMNFLSEMGMQEGGYIDRVVKSDSLKQALLDKPMIDYFTRGEMKSTKNKPLGIIQKRVLSGELEPEDGLNMLLNFEKMNYMKSKGDTTNVLFDTLKEAGYQEGGEVEDKRDRKNGYSLGVKDYYAQALVEFGKMGDFVGGATGSNRRAILEAAQEAGDIMETQEALESLKLIADRHQQGTMNVMANPRQGYQYGGATTEDLYADFGQRLTYGTDRRDFEKAYGSVDVSGFTEAREDLGTRGRQDLKNIRAQQSGQLFQDPTATTSAYQSYETGTQRALDDALEQHKLNALSYLGDVESGGASFSDAPVAGRSQPAGAPNVNSLPTTDEGQVMFNGQLYGWNPSSNSYEIIPDYDSNYP